MSSCVSCGEYIPEGYGWVCSVCSEEKPKLRIMAIDPGESIGVVLRTSECVYGATITTDLRLRRLWAVLEGNHPDVIVFEEFALRQSAAKKLVGNKFITCEVIGVIKLYAQKHGCPLIPLIPANKEYCGFSANPKDPHFAEIKMVQGEKITEHTRDAFRLLRYAELFKLKGGQTDEK